MVRERVFATSSLPLFFCFLFWALVLTYPLVLHPLTFIPLGDEPAGTVPLFNLWTLQWNIDQLMQGYPHYWDAPIFAPYTGTFAFSEIQPITALLAAPIWLGFQSPALAYNFVTILFLTLNGWFAHWLMRSWGGTRVTALLTGVLMQSLPFVAQEMGVLQLIAIFSILWLLLFLTRFLAQSSWSNAVGLAIGGPVTFFTCSYYGLFSLLFLPLALLFQLKKDHLQTRFAIRFMAALLLAAVLIIPLVKMQQQQLSRYGFTRSEKTITNSSATLIDYSKFLDHNLLYSTVLAYQSETGQRLFPGFGLIVLASVGLLGRSHKGLKAYLVTAVILAICLSMGLRLQIGDVQPYRWVIDYIPGFHQLRSPFRFAVVAQTHLALLAGFGLLNLEQGIAQVQMSASPIQRISYSLRNDSTQLASLVPLLAALLAIVEALAVPLPLHAVPQLQAGALWQTWLNHHGKSPRVVMLPFASGARAADFEATTRWMLEIRYTKASMVNGYSGFFPRDHPHLRAQMNRFPTTEGIDLLYELQVDYVIVHHDLADWPLSEKIAEALPLVVHDDQSNVSIYALDRECHRLCY